MGPDRPQSSRQSMPPKRTTQEKMSSTVSRPTLSDGELELERSILVSVKGRAVGGVASLVARELAVRLIQLAGGIALARILAPATFGLFAISYFAVNVFALFSELGLGAAFIRRQEAVSDKELESLFTFQLILVCILAACLFMLAPAFSHVYRVSDATWMIRALSVALILISLRTVPVVIAERNLSYGPIMLSDVVRQVAFWILAVTLAVAGFGAWSLILGTLLSAAAGTGVLYATTSWRPRLRFDWRPIAHSARFGLMYQGQAVTHFVKDTMTPSIGGLLYGSVAVGYLSWAIQLAGIPLLLTDIVSRVSYPALAKLQRNREAFISLLDSTLRWTCRLSLPGFAVLGGLAPQITEVMFGHKWLPALPSLYILGLNMVLSVGTGILMPSLYSLGKASVGLRISIGWTVITWATSVILAIAGVGFESIAVAYAVGTLIALVAIIFEVSRIGHVNFADIVFVPVLSATVMGAFLHFMGHRLIQGGLINLIAVALIAGALGEIINVWPDRHRAVNAVKLLLTQSVGKGNRPEVFVPGSE